MNHLICTWSSNEMYNGRLVPAEGVGNRMLRDLDSVRQNEVMIIVGYAILFHVSDQEVHDIGCDNIYFFS